MFRNTINTQSLTTTLTRFLLGMAVLVSFVTVVSAQAQDVYLGIKTGNETGAGGYGSKIKVKITFVNNTGATEVGESWLSNATLEAGGWSMAKLSMRYDMSLNPSVKTIRLENHGSNSALTGDNWQCESVCVSYDGNLCSENFVINQWLNGGAWVEEDNPNFRAPRRPEPPRPVIEATPNITVDMVLGTFQRYPVENGYHTGSITRDGDQLRWTNQAGVSWGVTPDFERNRLLTNRENPYYQDGHREFTLIIANGQVRGIRFAGEDYLRNSRIPTVQPPQPAPELVRPNPEPVASTRPAPDVNVRDANGDTLLHQAIRARDARAITDYVRRGVDVNTVNNAGMTPLSEAVRREDQPVSLVKYLLRNRANPNAPDSQGNTPVAYAAHTRNAQLLLAMLEAGGDVNVAADHLMREGDEQTFRTVVEKYNVSVSNEMFMNAIRSQNYGIAEMGIGRGVDPNYALDTALRGNVRQLVEPAMRAGANADATLKFAMQKRDSALAQLALNQYNASADLALQLAIPNNDLSILQMALQKGADATSGLPEAAKLGNQQIVEALLNGRADANAGLMPAVQAGKSRIVELLVTRGANPNPAMPFAVKSNDTNLVSTLLRANADGRAPQLMGIAAGNQNLAMVKILLAAGADANAGMEVAVTANSLEVARFLLDNNADGANPRFIALGARNGNRAIVTMFLERGADPTAGLGGAVVGGHSDLVDFLLKNKANGIDPRLIAHAAGKGDVRVTALLLAAGAQAEAGMKAGVNSGSAEVVNLLADAGANAKVPDYILSACKAGNAALAVALLKHDAPKDVMDERGQPLIQIATLTWKLELVTALLQNGVNPNQKNQAGETALHIVARDEASPGYPKFKKMKKDRLPILNALIAGKADVNAANNKGEFVLKVADGGDVKDILKAAGAVKDQKELDKRGQ